MNEPQHLDRFAHLAVPPLKAHVPTL
jgi:hypothetical protein